MNYCDKPVPLLKSIADVNKKITDYVNEHKAVLAQAQILSEKLENDLFQSVEGTSTSSEYTYGGTSSEYTHGGTLIDAYGFEYDTGFWGEDDGTTISGTPPANALSLEFVNDLKDHDNELYVHNDLFTPNPPRLRTPPRRSSASSRRSSASSRRASASSRRASASSRRASASSGRSSASPRRASASSSGSSGNFATSIDEFMDESLYDKGEKESIKARRGIARRYFRIKLPEVDDDSKEQFRIRNPDADVDDETALLLAIQNGRHLFEQRGEERGFFSPTKDGFVVDQSIFETPPTSPTSSTSTSPLSGTLPPPPPPLKSPSLGPPPPPIPPISSPRASKPVGFLSGIQKFNLNNLRKGAPESSSSYKPPKPPANGVMTEMLNNAKARAKFFDGDSPTKQSPKDDSEFE